MVDWVVDAGMGAFTRCSLVPSLSSLKGVLQIADHVAWGQWQVVQRQDNNQCFPKNHKRVARRVRGRVAIRYQKWSCQRYIYKRWSLKTPKNPLTSMPHNPSCTPAPLRPLAMALAGVLLSSTSWAATFVVNDSGDAPLASGMCTGGANPCTLRAAIQAANANAGQDTIQFNFSGGQITISPTSALPVIVNPVTIDGYALGAGSPNTLAVGNDAYISIRIDGQNAGAPASGLQFLPGATNSSVRGLAITRFASYGVVLSGQGVSNGLTNVTVEGNFIGTDGTGVGDDGGGLLANGLGGILMSQLASNNAIGGSSVANRNLIVGSNSGVGISLGDAHDNRVLNNYVGINRAGDSRRATSVGVGIHASFGSLVSRNLIGASDIGVYITGNASNSFLQGNRIGVGPSGASITAPGSRHGVYIINIGTASPQGTRIGGADPGEGNLIAHWGGDGIHVERNTPAAPDLRYHQWSGNSIHSNGGLGIELIDTATGQGTGPMAAAPTTVNASPRYPLVLGATGNAAGTLVNFEFAGASNASYRMEVFSNAACDASNFGEGQTYLGAVGITTDVGGAYTRMAAMPSVPAGSRVTMAATLDYTDGNSTRESSEFSQCMTVAAGPGGGGPVTAVPTLGHLGLILLSTLLGAIGLRARRSR